MSNEELNRELHKANLCIDQAEVLLRNLLRLRRDDDTFAIEHLDVIVTIQTAVKILTQRCA